MVYAIPQIQSVNLLQAQLNKILGEIYATTPVVLGTVQTTTATQTTAATIPTTSDAAVQLQLFVQGRRTGGTAGTAGDSAAYQLAVGAKNVSGTVTILNQAALLTAESQAGWDATVTASGGNLLVRVTGAANNNVDWSVSGCKFEVT